MRAMDDGGSEYWSELSEEERSILESRAQTTFESPYRKGTTETPGGSSNVKNVFEVNQHYPEGHLTVGRWWDTHSNPEDYYKKRGFGIEDADVGGGGPKSKEIR